MSLLWRTGVPLALLALSGCGGSSNSSSATSSLPVPSSTTPSTAFPMPVPADAGRGSLKLAAEADEQLKFNTTSLRAERGRVTLAFANPSSLPHNVTIASNSGAVLGATPTFRDGTRTLTLNLKPGIYRFYCSVPGHRQAGMQGTLRVG